MKCFNYECDDQKEGGGCDWGYGPENCIDFIPEPEQQATAPVDSQLACSVSGRNENLITVRELRMVIEDLPDSAKVQIYSREEEMFFDCEQAKATKAKWGLLLS